MANETKFKHGIAIGDDDLTIKQDVNGNTVFTDKTGEYRLDSIVGKYQGVNLPQDGSTAMTRTGGDDAENHWWLKGVKMVLLANDLTENAVIADYFNPEIQPGAILDGSMGQVMAKIPKVYYREFFNDAGTLIRVDLSAFKLLGYTCHPKFLRPNGTEREFVYIGAYEASNSPTNVLQSVSGAPVLTSQTLATFRARAFARGAGWFPYDFWTHHLIQLLFYVRHGTFDSQTALPGYTEASGWDYAYTRPTGRSNILTSISGSVDALLGVGELDEDLNAAGITAGEKIANRFLFIENIYGHIWKFLDGCAFNGRIGEQNTAYVTADPAKFSSDEATIRANYEDLGIDLPSDVNANYIKNLQQGFLPKEFGGGSTTYVTDYFWSYLDDETRDYFRSVRLGGCLFDGGQAGVAARYSGVSLGHASSAYGSRLCAAP